MSKQVGITVRKAEDFSEWYTQVVLKAELADYSAVKGAMVLRPYGYAIWEKIRNYFDRRIARLGHKNVYFPALIPESLLRREAEHFAGFTPEVFWVTRAGDEDLGERLALRPTSETIAYDSYSKWIRSWRDLPLLLNFWNSVLRAEIKSTKPFIRTSEFLWQEGHTVHATEEDADKETLTILSIYRQLIENQLAIPVLQGMKTEKEKFLGALYTTTLEALMPDGRALQMGTSHNLGQNFSRPFEIRYLGKDGKEYYAWQTCWGISWRLIGALVMVHGDDRGLILPPRIAPIQIVIVPIYYGDDAKSRVYKKAREVVRILRRRRWSVHFDDREQYTPGWKFNEWELKGAPLRVEIGPRDVAERRITLVRRDNFEKSVVVDAEVVETVGSILKDIQKSLYNRATAYLKKHTRRVVDYQDFKRQVEDDVGFLKACWCGDSECEQAIKQETGVDIRLIPLEEERVFSDCIYCRNRARHVAYFAKAY